MSPKENDQLGRRLRAITGDLKSYIEKRIELLLLNIGEHFARMMAESVQKVAGILLLSGASVCLLVALALYLGDLLNSRSLGYVLVSIPLLIAGFSFFFLKPRSMVDGIQDYFEKEIVQALLVAENEEKDRLRLEREESEEEMENK